MEARDKQREENKLGNAISRRLKQDLSDWGTFRFNKGSLFLLMHSDHIERELGGLLQKIHQVVDVNFPDRQSDIPLMIVDEQHKYCLKLKIWHTAPLVY